MIHYEEGTDRDHSNADHGDHEVFLSKLLHRVSGSFIFMMIGAEVPNLRKELPYRNLASASLRKQVAVFRIAEGTPVSGSKATTTTAG
jgi:hypothetical protein